MNGGIDDIISERVYTITPNIDISFNILVGYHQLHHVDNRVDVIYSL